MTTEDPAEVPSFVPGLNVAIGRVVRAYREARGYSPTQVARALHMPLRTIQNVEDGRYPLSTSQLWRLSYLFGAPMWGIMRSVETELTEVQREWGAPAMTDDPRLVASYGGTHRLGMAKAAQKEKK